MGRRRPTALALALLGASTGACADDGGAGAGAGPAAGGAGGAGGGVLSPTDYLDPSDYDCTAPPDPAPGARPHTLGCILDPTCAADLVCAHRMGNPFAPENSLSALRASILLGVDIVETDARITSDGRVVLVHDAEVDRTLEGSGNVRDFTLAELKAMPVRLEPGDPPGDFSCERVVTIEEVMALASGRIVVELETKDVEAGVAAAEHLSTQGLYASAYVQCAPSECDAIRAAVPDAPIMVRVNSLADLDLAEAYDPPPLLVEVDPGPPYTEPPVLDRIHAIPARAFTNAFLNADATAIITGDLSQYAVGYAAGLDVLQTEFPHLALTGLGRIQPRPEP
jgi:glycerophosphoryl diester phosphodiesterase